MKRKGTCREDVIKKKKCLLEKGCGNQRKGVMVRRK